MARTSFEFNLGKAAPDARRLDEESPLRILVIGDLSGGAGGGAGGGLAARRPLEVDIDSFDQVLRRIAPRYTTPRGEEIAFGELDDFHPDALVKRVRAFERLRELKQRLGNSATFSAAAEEFRAQLNAPAVEASRAAPAPSENDSDTLSRLLGGSGGAAPAASAASGINAFIRDVVAEHVQPDAPAHQSQYVAAADAAIGAEMNSILHDPRFQSLEAAWRGVYWLVSNLELGETLRLSLLDATKAELLEDLTANQDDLSRTVTYKTLVEAAQVAGAEPWSLVVGAYEFGPHVEDIAVLATVGAIAAQAGAAFIASASPELAGAPSYANADPSSWQEAEGDRYAAWNALRRSAMAPHIALAAPRVLMRLPYGKSTDRVSAFDLDELGAERTHESYLWGGAAFACALLIGRAFTEHGWEMTPGDALDVDDLPAHTYEEDGEKRMQACAETYLSERAGQALIERGLVPLLSYANRNAVRVMRFQSIAQPPRELAGPWR
ncbi:MAG TPA: type VI secretion system contractile sheath large subunit [Burkholderiales bacterium]|nr:type VI secretion system contractile sheath large subunit [Burkholderiales bacterium]